jgi:hypothetical protein
MRGIKSNGMLLAASDASHENVELLTPPQGSCPGERIWFGSEEESNVQSDAASPNQVFSFKCFLFKKTTIIFDISSVRSEYASSSLRRPYSIYDKKALVTKVERHHKLHQTYIYL